ncbi:hypothetical protein L596_004490 [Steinernema carpocapsae]|uniref:Uncharacterized protein n=1 Tax=Steinernema carpocapsae TaxID=34508 RepID=A0A4U8UW49_STECR|nr:hypothetical protein L596_004490 [Steinernema carpocapsae]
MSLCNNNNLFELITIFGFDNNFIGVYDQKRDKRAVQRKHEDSRGPPTRKETSTHATQPIRALLGSNGSGEVLHNSQRANIFLRLLPARNRAVSVQNCDSPYKMAHSVARRCKPLMESDANASDQRAIASKLRTYELSKIASFVLTTPITLISWSNSNYEPLFLLQRHRGSWKARMQAKFGSLRISPPDNSPPPFRRFAAKPFRREDISPRSRFAAGHFAARTFRREEFTR